MRTLHQFEQEDRTGPGAPGSDINILFCGLRVLPTDILTIPPTCELGRGYRYCVLGVGWDRDTGNGRRAGEDRRNEKSLMMTTATYVLL